MDAGTPEFHASRKEDFSGLSTLQWAIPNVLCSRDGPGSFDETVNPVSGHKRAVRGRFRVLCEKVIAVRDH